MRFKDKVVLVTGATRNTGLSIAEAFAKEGCVLVLNGRDADDVTREADRIRSLFGGTVVEAVADVSKPEAVDAMFEIVEQECGQLDVLVNNAIIQGCGYMFPDTPAELLQSVFAVNVFGSYYCGQGAARMMVAAGKGAIVNMGSNTSDRAIRERTAYCASKGAVDSLTRAMAIELGPSNIRVNSVVAGYIYTDRWEALTTEIERRRANIPIGREALGCDIADAVLFMASDEASKVSGARLVVDGGVSAQIAPPDCDI